MIPSTDQPLPAKRRRAATKPLAVTISEARHLTGLGTTTIYGLLKDQKLKSVLIGRRRLILFDSIENLLTTGHAA